MKPQPYALTYQDLPSKLSQRHALVPTLGAVALVLGHQQADAAVFFGGGGENKATATTVTLTELADGFSCISTTVGAANDISSYPGQTTLTGSYIGADHWYTFTLPVAADLAATLGLTGSTGDLAMFLLSSGGTGSDAIATSQDLIGAGAGPETLTKTNLPAGQYYLVIDSYYAAGSPSGSGSYNLRFAPMAVNVPEPTTTGLLAGLGGLFMGRRRQKK